MRATTSGSSALPPRATRVTAVNEVVDITDTLLQQVADALRAVTDQFDRELRVAVLSEKHDAHRRDAFAQLDRRAKPIVISMRRHPDVDHRDVRSVNQRLGEEVHGVTGLGDDAQARRR